MQIQLEKEKQTYDFEAMESQLDKALGQATRLQKEREGVQLEMDRMRDKYDKVQVSATDRADRGATQSGALAVRC